MPLSDDDRASIDEFRVLSCAQCNLSPEVPVCKHALITTLDKLSINTRSVRYCDRDSRYVHDNGNLAKADITVNPLWHATHFRYIYLERKKLDFFYVNGRNRSKFQDRINRAARDLF